MRNLERAVSALRKALAPDRVTTAAEDMVVYSYDGTWVVGRPEIAITPLDAREVAAAVRVAADEGTPLSRAAQRVDSPAAPCQSSAGWSSA